MARPSRITSDSLNLSLLKKGDTFVFAIELPTNHCSILDLPAVQPWTENIQDIESSAKLNKDNWFYQSLQLDFGHTKKRFCDWNIVPLYHSKPRYWAIEQALIQLWQPSRNFPFIVQLSVPRKGIIKRQPFSMPANLASNPFGVDTVTDTLLPPSSFYSPLLCSILGSAPGQSSKTSGPTPNAESNRANTSAALPSPSQDVMPSGSLPFT